MTTYKYFLNNSKNVKIDKNFTLYEIIHSETAEKLNIDNRLPNNNIYKNAELLIKKVLQPIRDYFKSPVSINCFYRCEKLNNLVGGAKTSQHLNGQAVDFYIKNVKLINIFNYIKNNLEFDQLILEKNQWIHVSYKQKNNRKECLIFDGIKYKKVF